MLKAIFSLMLCVLLAPVFFIVAFILEVCRFILSILFRVFETLSQAFNKFLHQFLQFTSSLWYEIAK
jgi:hypothetical protein